ncbi:hypothetical protein [Burkholderia cenocepacia]|uniref:hypothetical protein n=1 Tax=Burkholderia cenocepacia TaxID=95486 RepID=UPI00209AA3F6|nr:hypothetical protein [Burkholderia cenocepacia]
MGILLRDDQASYRANAKGMIFPISDAGLEFVGVFGGDLTASSRNFAANKPALAPVGSPTVNEDSIVLTGSSAFLQTEMAGSIDLTFIAIARPLEMVGHVLISNYRSVSLAHSGTTIGASLYTVPEPGPDNDGLKTVVFERAVTDGNASIFAGVSLENDQGLGVYQFLCGRFDSSAKAHRVNNLTTGHSFTSGPEPRALDLGGTFRIGAGYAAGEWEGKSEFVSAIGMSRCITDHELTTLYQFWKGYCSRRGIVI